MSAAPPSSDGGIIVANSMEGSGLLSPPSLALKYPPTRPLPPKPLAEPMSDDLRKTKRARTTQPLDDECMNASWGREPSHAPTEMVAMAYRQASTALAMSADGPTSYREEQSAPYLPEHIEATAAIIKSEEIASPSAQDKSHDIYLATVQS